MSSNLTARSNFTFTIFDTSISHNVVYKFCKFEAEWVNVIKTNLQEQLHIYHF